ncbi:MAG: FAD-binding oxidoreductase [Haliscomenobacter sp.]|nr:FAD-binding oxidoreductase [Haliscomenobacter sp.]
MHFDFLLIGQGLAGSLLAHFLKKAGASVVIIDDAHCGGASAEAAGLINPITGRRLAKSWRIDELIPFAEKTYAELEAQFRQPFFQRRPIIRALFSAKEDNDWAARARNPEYSRYLMEEPVEGPILDFIQPAYGFGQIRESGQVEVAALLSAFAAWGFGEGWLRPGHFDYSKLILENGKARYEGLQAERVVFCEGYGLHRNPFFNYLPMEGNKGEVLLIRIPGFPRDWIFKHKVFIAPYTGDRFWVGASYLREFEDALPSARERERLENVLQRALKAPFVVEDHRAAIRPTVPDRRPLLGIHPEHPQLAVFNGLGTKGRLWRRFGGLIWLRYC